MQNAYASDIKAQVDTFAAHAKDLENNNCQKNFEDYFIKLNLAFNCPEVTAGEVEDQHGFIVDGVFRGIWYANLDDKKLDVFKKIIPLQHQNKFCLSLMSVNSMIFPHTDSDAKAVINFYLKTEGCITQFYEVKADAKNYQIESQTDGNCYSLDDLEVGPSFIAQPGDVYLLNVKKPHAVYPFTADKILINRSALNLSTSKLTFEETKGIVLQNNIA